MNVKEIKFFTIKLEASGVPGKGGAEQLTASGLMDHYENAVRLAFYGAK